MKRAALILQSLAMLLLTLSLFGCGASSNQGNGVAPNQTATPIITPGTTPMTTTIPSGQVTLTLSKQQYTPEEPLLITIHNDASVPIWVQGLPSGCTSLSVERMTNGSWTTIGGCAPARTPQTVKIAAGNALSQSINYAQGMDTGAGWPAGMYRVTLHYSLSATASTGAGLQIQSSTFAIQ